LLVVAVPGRTDGAGRHLRSALLAGRDAPNSAVEDRCGDRRCRSDGARHDCLAVNRFALDVRSTDHRRGTCRATPAEALQVAGQGDRNSSCDPLQAGRIAADVRGLMGVGRTA
jgi:hypothetical protein